jgi:phosphatidylglycerophosphate synthase
VVFCEENTGALRVAALSLLDRLVVALHRAGCRPITVVCRGPLPDLRRSRAWQIDLKVVPEAPPFSGPMLAASTGLLVQPSDVRELIRQRGRLTAADGTSLPIGVVETLSTPLLAQLSTLPAVTAKGVAAAIRSPEMARAAERALWASLTSSSDGLVDIYFNRPAGRPLSRLLIHTAVSPNAVSIASILLGLLAAVYFAVGNYTMAVAGAVLFQLSAIVDCVDGDIARAVFKESPLGRWLDLAGDQVVHISVFAAIAIGLWRQESAAPVAWLGASAVAGAVLSFVAVVRGMKRVTEKSNTLLRRLLDSATNRDFSVLVFALALLEKLEVFLWLTGAGSHLFWIALLWLQRREPGAESASASASR